MTERLTPEQREYLVGLLGRMTKGTRWEVVLRTLLAERDALEADLRREQLVSHRLALEFVMERDREQGRAGKLTSADLLARAETELARFRERARRDLPAPDGSDLSMSPLVAARRERDPNG